MIPLSIAWRAKPGQETGRNLLFDLALPFLAVALASVSCGKARGLGRDIAHFGDGIDRVAR